MILLSNLIDFKVKKLHPSPFSRKGEALAAANTAVGIRGRAGPSLPGSGHPRG